MKLPIYQVDAFTSRVFAGNPAAVVLLDEWPVDELLQAVAAENNLSETGFVVPGVERFHIRWFTPAVEVSLCGHGTLAASFVLFAEGMAQERIRYECLSGELEVWREEDRICMDFPLEAPAAVPGDTTVSEALGAAPLELHASRYLLALFSRQEDVEALDPDFDRLATHEASGLIVTAPGREADFVSRFFCPKMGILEDPVTGSAHCSLIPFWAERLGRKRLRALQVSPRGGELFCEARGERVTIAGRAVQYLRGEITV